MARKEKYKDRLIIAVSGFRLLVEHPDISRSDAERAEILKDAKWAMDELMKIRNITATVTSLDYEPNDALAVFSDDGDER